MINGTFLATLKKSSEPPGRDAGYGFGLYFKRCALSIITPKLHKQHGKKLPPSESVRTDFAVFQYTQVFSLRFCDYLQNHSTQFCCKVFPRVIASGKFPRTASSLLQLIFGKCRNMPDNICNIRYFIKNNILSHPNEKQRLGDYHIREGFNLKEMSIDIINARFEIIYTRYTFSPFTWFFKELFTMGEKRNLPGIGIMILPFIWFSAKLESLLNLSRGNGILIVARKR